MSPYRLALIIFSISFFSSNNSKANSTLEPMNAPEFEQLLVASEVTLSPSRKIYVADASVNFAKRWYKSEGKETTDHYQEGIIKQYAVGLKTKLTDALTNAGWEVVDSSDGVIHVTPKIYDLYILAPDVSGIKQTIVSYVGGAGIELVFKSQDNQTFMKIVDYAKTQDSGSGAVTANRMNNYHYFKLLMTDWSNNATAYLEEIMKIADSQTH